MSKAKLKNTREVTEIPEYAINEDREADDFFTKPEIARSCYDKFIEVVGAKINLDEFMFIEPSAGNGSFLNLCPEDRRLGLDLTPKSDGIIQANYLTWGFPTGGETKYIVIGNPPFGKRGATALAFINRSFLYADFVAMILPMGFYSSGKISNMSRVEGGTLVYNEVLDPDAFFFPESGKTKTVATVFQIWAKDPTGFTEVKFDTYDHSEFLEMYSCSAKNMEKPKHDFDCFIASTFYDKVKVEYEFENVKYNQGIGLVIKKDKERIIEILEGVNWVENSSLATNHCRHISKWDVGNVLYKNGIGKIGEPPVKKKESFIEAMNKIDPMSQFVVVEGDLK